MKTTYEATEGRLAETDAQKNSDEVPGAVAVSDECGLHALERHDRQHEHVADEGLHA